MAEHRRARVCGGNKVYNGREREMIRFCVRLFGIREEEMALDEESEGERECYARELEGRKEMVKTVLCSLSC